MPTKQELFKIAVLDDYQNVALSMADWSRLDGQATVTVFDDHLPNTDAVVARLQPFDVNAVDERTFRLEGDAIVAIDIGHTDTDHTTCLHVPSIGLVVAGDAIYNGTHPYLVESDRQGLNEWLAAIDKIEDLNPRAVVVGHGPLDPDNSPRHIQETRHYIQHFIRLNGETATAQELYDRMLALYPDRINPGSLWGSAHAAKAAQQAKV